MTYGSAMRLQNIATAYYLYSFDIKYGYGSGQQCITGHTDEEEPGSLWYIKEAHDKQILPANTIIKCGDLIRLEHVMSGKNLHSHEIRSHIAGGWEEVSGFGNGGVGDGGDNFRLVCDNKREGQEITGEDIFYLQHEGRGTFVGTDRAFAYNQHNCGYHCPIMGQLEISATRNREHRTKWKFHSGILLLTRRSAEASSNSRYDYEQDL